MHLRLLSRVGFICNICFLLASFIQYLPNPPEGPAVQLVILLGYLLSIFVNLFVNAWAIVLVARRRLRQAQVPVWLLVVNFIFLLLQLSLLTLFKK
jgi:hypothetical protein